MDGINQLRNPAEPKYLAQGYEDNEADQSATELNGLSNQQAFVPLKSSLA